MQHKYDNMNNMVCKCAAVGWLQTYGHSPDRIDIAFPFGPLGTRWRMHGNYGNYMKKIWQSICDKFREHMWGGCFEDCWKLFNSVESDW